MTVAEWAEANLYYYRARYYDTTLGRFASEDPIKFWGGDNFYRYVHNRLVNFIDPFGLAGRDYNEQQTLQVFLQPAYSDATAGYYQGLWNIRNHSTGKGDFDFAHNEHAGDTFNVCGRKMSAGDFGNFIAGFQGAAWDRKYYWVNTISITTPVTWLIPVTVPPGTARNAVVWAGIYYHMSGDTDVQNDPWDKTGIPWISLGDIYGDSFSKSKGGCGCLN